VYIFLTIGQNVSYDS